MCRIAVIMLTHNSVCEVAAVNTIAQITGHSRQDASSLTAHQSPAGLITALDDCRTKTDPILIEAGKLTGRQALIIALYPHFCSPIRPPLQLTSARRRFTALTLYNGIPALIPCGGISAVFYSSQGSHPT
jgi:hypothetical protein